MNMNYKENLLKSQEQPRYKEQLASYKLQFLDTDLRRWTSGRLSKAARKHNVKTIKQLIKAKTVTVQKWRGVGPKTMEELLDFKQEMILVNK